MKKLLLILVAVISMLCESSIVIAAPDPGPTPPPSGKP